MSGSGNFRSNLQHRNAVSGTGQQPRTLNMLFLPLKSSTESGVELKYRDSPQVFTYGQSAFMS